MLVKSILFAKFLNLQFGGKTLEKKWNTLVHNGILFEKPYKKHNVKIKYNNQTIELNELQEEMITEYAKKINTKHFENPIFKENFWKSWKKVLGEKHIIKNLDECDLSDLNNYLLKEKEKEKMMDNDSKKQKIEIIKKMEEQFKIAFVDGKEQTIDNFKAEPACIFIGRGDHPLMGTWKPRLMPCDVILNLGKDAKIPKPFYIDDNKLIEIKNNNWKEIVHNNYVEWIASWKEPIMGKIKYIWLGHTSDIKMDKTQQKFDLAKTLKKKITVIRNENNKNLISNDIKTKQIATALYFIDNYALRVGNEKGDDETDTIGVTLLRVEHINLKENNKVELDFLGKDSIRYCNTHEVDKQIYENLKIFMNGKKKTEDLFDKIKSNDINKYLNNFMENLTAKVFRTYNASNTFQKELNKIYQKYEKEYIPEELNSKQYLKELINLYNNANLKVAKLCNHQKNSSKSYKDKIKEIDDKINDLKNNANDKNKDKIKKLKIQKNLIAEKGDIALGTSKENYIDPRISVVFIKKYNIPIEKIFPQKLINKFKWAFDIDYKTWTF